MMFVKTILALSFAALALAAPTPQDEGLGTSLLKQVGGIVDRILHAVGSG
ncbi:hypothetical protein BGW80DRAFT_1564924 [Lactifluus volemus]|nr:hypothetical protein BGW80DRAFT_1564924 [Lactifluus volemus]